MSWGGADCHFHRLPRQIPEKTQRKVTTGSSTKTLAMCAYVSVCYRFSEVFFSGMEYEMQSVLSSLLFSVIWRMTHVVGGDLMAEIPDGRLIPGGTPHEMFRTRDLCEMADILSL